jgi:hypothetical protein
MGAKGVRASDGKCGKMEDFETIEGPAVKIDLMVINAVEHE